MRGRCQRICGGCTGPRRCLTRPEWRGSVGTWPPRSVSSGARPGRTRGRPTRTWSTSWSPGTTAYPAWPGCLPDSFSIQSKYLLVSSVCDSIIREFELTSSMKKNDPDSLSWPHRFRFCFVNLFTLHHSPSDIVWVVRRPFITRCTKCPQSRGITMTTRVTMSPQRPSWWSTTWCSRSSGTLRARRRIWRQNHFPNGIGNVNSTRFTTGRR